MQEILNNAALSIKSMNTWKFNVPNWHPVYRWADVKEIVEMENLSKENVKFFFKEQLSHLFYIFRFELTGKELSLTTVSVDVITNEIYNVEKTGMLDFLLGRGLTVELEINFLKTVIDKYMTYE